MSRPAPIGIFDSGVGGLSVAREVRARLPHESLLYFADTAFCPYGGRPLDVIRARSLAVCEELVRRGVKTIVVACNTASGAALEALRAALDVPIVGLEPAVKPAARLSRNGRIGVMATEATLRTERFGRLTSNHARGVEVYAQACPGLVELVESGETHGEEVRRVLQALLRPLREVRVDTVVLGCTHYPFVREVVAEVLGPDVRILDSGAAVARQVERVLRERGALSTGGDSTLRLLTTGNPEQVRPVAERLWTGPLQVDAVRI